MVFGKGGGNYNILGYSARGRLPLNHALRAGQFQSARLGSVNIWAGYGDRTVVNNYYSDGYGYGYGYGYEDQGMSSLMKWAMGLSIGGGILGFIGNMITALGGGGKSEGRGGTENSTEENTLNIYRDTYKQYCKISERLDDGSYLVTPKGGIPKKVKFEDLQTYLNELAISSKSNDNVSELPEVKVQPKTGNEAVSIQNDGIDADTANYNKMLALYKENGIDNTPVKIGSEFDIEINTPIGIYDDSENIGDFKNAKVVRLENSDEGTVLVMSNGRKYVNINPYDDGCVYFKDLNTESGNEQIYILEKNADGKYEMHQREFLSDKTIGYDIAATKAHRT